MNLSKVALQLSQWTGCYEMFKVNDTRIHSTKGSGIFTRRRCSIQAGVTCRYDDKKPNLPASNHLPPYIIFGRAKGHYLVLERLPFRWHFLRKLRVQRNLLLSEHYFPGVGGVGDIGEFTLVIIVSLGDKDASASILYSGSGTQESSLFVGVLVVEGRRGVRLVDAVDGKELTCPGQGRRPSGLGGWQLRGLHDPF